MCVLAQNWADMWKDVCDYLFLGVSSGEWQYACCMTTTEMRFSGINSTSRMCSATFPSVRHLLHKNTRSKKRQSLRLQSHLKKHQNWPPLCMNSLWIKWSMETLHHSPVKKPLESFPEETSGIKLWKSIIGEQQSTLGIIRNSTVQ